MASEPVMRVGVDATPLLGRPTGVGVFCRGVLAGLSGLAGLDVCAYAVTWRRRDLLPAVLPPGVAVTQRPMPARPLHAAWRRVDVPALERFVGPLDVVHGTNFVVPPTRRAAPVVTVHDLTPLRFPELCDAGSLAFPDLVRRALRRGAWVHTHSEFVADEVADAFGVDRHRVRAVPPGIPDLGGPDARGPGAGAPDAPDGQASPLSLPPGTHRYVLSIGTAEPRKDLPALVRAFAGLAGDRPDLALVLAGPDGWGTEALDQAIAASPFRDRIVRTGWVDDPMLGRMLALAAVLAFPSVYEGFGLPPLQAMAAGVPVVATTGGSIPEALGDAARLVPVGDVDALADALAAVVDDEDERQRLVQRGLERAQGYTWERCATGLAALYRDARQAWGRR